MEKPTLNTRISAANVIIALGADRTGLRTKHTLSWPFKDFDDHKLERESAQIMYIVFSCFLKVLPPHDLERIEQEINERLAFVA